MQIAWVEGNDDGKEVGFYKIDFHHWCHYYWRLDVRGCENESCHVEGEGHGQQALGLEAHCRHLNKGPQWV